MLRLGVLGHRCKHGRRWRRGKVWLLGKWWCRIKWLWSLRRLLIRKLRRRLRLRKLSKVLLHGCIGLLLFAHENARIMLANLESMHADRHEGRPA